MKKIYSTILLAFSIQSAIAQNLVAHYPLDGNGDDASGNNLHGVVTGAVGAQDRNSLTDGAMLFTTNSDMIRVSDTSAFNLGYRGSVTISAWFNISANTNQCAIFHSGTDAWQTGMLLGLNWAANKIIFGAGATGFFNTANVIGFSSKNTYTDGLWHHVVVTVDPANDAAKMYVDGAIVKIEHYDAFGTTGGSIVSDSTVQTLSGVNYSLKPSVSSITIGNSQYNQFFDGKIDDLRIYNYALDATQVSQLTSTGNVKTLAISEGNISVFPNPVSDQLNINSSEMINNIQILDLNGNLVLNKSAASKQLSIALNLSAGFYMVKVETAGGTHTEKIIIQ